MTDMKITGGLEFVAEIDESIQELLTLEGSKDILRSDYFYGAIADCFDELHPFDETGGMRVIEVHSGGDYNTGDHFFNEKDMGDYQHSPYPHLDMVITGGLDVVSPDDASATETVVEGSFYIEPESSEDRIQVTGGLHKSYSLP